MSVLALCTLIKFRGRISIFLYSGYQLNYVTCTNYFINSLKVMVLTFVIQPLWYRRTRSSGNSSVKSHASVNGLTVNCTASQSCWVVVLLFHCQRYQSVPWLQHELHDYWQHHLFYELLSETEAISLHMVLRWLTWRSQYCSYSLQWKWTYSTTCPFIWSSSVPNIIISKNDPSGKHCNYFHLATFPTFWVKESLQPRNLGRAWK